MKNRLQIRYHIPESLPTRAQAMTYLKDTFAIGRTNSSNASLPAEPLVILYNDTLLDVAKGITESERLATSNVLLAIGRGGDGVNVLNNQDYFVIDFAKHEEEIQHLDNTVENILEVIEDVKSTIEEMKANIKKNSDDIANIIKKIGEKGDQCEKDTVYGYIQCAHDAIEEEKNRAEDVEQDLLHAIEIEKERADSAEKLLQTNINNLNERLNTEENLRIEGDEINRTAINNEFERASGEETRIDGLLTAEIERAKDAESKLDDDIHLEYERAFKAEGDLNKRIDNEETIARAAEAKNAEDISILRTDLNNEINLSRTERNRIEDKFDNEVLELKTKDAELTSTINDVDTRLKEEINTARRNESNLQEQITKEIADRLEITLDNKNKIEDEITDRINADKILEQKIETNSSNIKSNKVKSDKKTIIVTGPTDNGTNLEVNVDNKTILINETGMLSVSSDALVQYKGENAIKVSEVYGSTKTISLEVNPNDNILTNDAQGLYATLSLKWNHADATGLKDEIQLIGKEGVVISRIDVSDFIKDGILDNVTLDSNDKNNPLLVFTFNSASGKETISLPVKDLVDIYHAGNGLQMNENTFSIKIDANSEIFLSVSSDGLKLSGIQDAIDNSKQEVVTLIGSKSTELSNSISVLTNALNTEKTERLESVKQLETSYKEDIASSFATLTQNYRDADTILSEQYKSADEILSERITINSNAISLLNGDVNTVGSVAKTVNDAKTELTSNIKNTDEKIRTDFAISDSALLTKIDANTTALNILNGDTNVDGSLKDVIFDSALGSIVNTISINDASEQSLIKKFTIDGVPYFYTSNKTSDMKHNDKTLNSVIDNLNNSVTDLNGSNQVLDVKIDELDDRITKNETALTSINDKLSFYEYSINGLKSEDERINIVLNSIQATLTDIQANLLQISTDLVEAKGDIAMLKANTITNINGTANEIKVVVHGNTATVGFDDDAYFVAGD